MELEEVKFRYLNLGSMVVKLLENEKLDTSQGLMRFFGLSETETPQEINMSVTRIIASAEFVVIKEVLTPTPNGPAINQIVLASSSKKQNGEKIFHSFNPKTQTGLPPSCLLRVPQQFTIHHATLKIEVVAGEISARKTVIKNIYYGKSFIMEL